MIKKLTDPTRYVILTSAHNLDTNENLKISKSVFILHRVVISKFAALFYVFLETIKKYSRYNRSNLNSNYSGHDIALAIVELKQGKEEDIPKEFPRF